MIKNDKNKIYVRQHLFHIVNVFLMQRKNMTIFFTKTNVNLIILYLYRYGGWSFGLPLTDDLRFDVTEVPANRTLAKVNYELSSGMS